MAEPTLENLIALLSKLPGLGPRSARRAVLHLLKHRESLLLPLHSTMKIVAENIRVCSECNNLHDTSPCNICVNPQRDRSLICVVEEVADLWAIERSNIFRGVYHILGGTLSALEGRGPEDLTIHRLLQRVDAHEEVEIILATNATIEGQTTAHYIMEKLKDKNVKITRLAQGIPVGGELDYLDDGTLGAALQSRQLV